MCSDRDSTHAFLIRDVLNLLLLRSYIIAVVRFTLLAFNPDVWVTEHMAKQLRHFVESSTRVLYIPVNVLSWCSNLLVVEE